MLKLLKMPHIDYYCKLKIYLVIIQMSFRKFGGKNFAPKNNIVSVYIRDAKFIEYNDKQSEEGILNFLSSDNWKKAPVIED